MQRDRFEVAGTAFVRDGAYWRPEQPEREPERPRKLSPELTQACLRAANQRPLPIREMIDDAHTYGWPAVYIVGLIGVAVVIWAVT